MSNADWRHKVCILASARPGVFVQVCACARVGPKVRRRWKACPHPPHLALTGPFALYPCQAPIPNSGSVLPDQNPILECCRTYGVHLPRLAREAKVDELHNRLLTILLREHTRRRGQVMTRPGKLSALHATRQRSGLANIRTTPPQANMRCLKRRSQRTCTAPQRVRQPHARCRLP